ncbi:MAG: hemolysin III family protein [Bacteroidota bacterium]
MKSPLSITEFRHELANSLSHGLGLLFGIVSMPILIALASVHGNTAGLVGASIFGFSFLMVYTFSTLYHGSTLYQSRYVARIQSFMRTMDHISIYFLIAGTYTPFILIYFLDPMGITMLSILWGLTAFGVVFKIFFTCRYEWVSLLLYLGMGWLLVFFAEPFYTELPTATFVMVAVGGALYTLGVIFYVWERLRYNHAIWHIFVLAASICHYVAVLLSV